MAERFALRLRLIGLRGLSAVVLPQDEVNAQIEEQGEPMGPKGGAEEDAETVRERDPSSGSSRDRRGRQGDDRGLRQNAPKNHPSTTTQRPFARVGFCAPAAVPQHCSGKSSSEKGSETQFLTADARISLAPSSPVSEDPPAAGSRIDAVEVETGHVRVSPHGVAEFDCESCAHNVLEAAVSGVSPELRTRCAESGVQPFSTEKNARDDSHASFLVRAQSNEVDDIAGADAVGVRVAVTASLRHSGSGSTGGGATSVTGVVHVDAAEALANPVAASLLMWIPLALVDGGDDASSFWLSPGAAALEALVQLAWVFPTDVLTLRSRYFTERIRNVLELSAPHAVSKRPASPASPRTPREPNHSFRDSADIESRDFGSDSLEASGGTSPVVVVEGYVDAGALPDSVETDADHAAHAKKKEETLDAYCNDDEPINALGSSFASRGATLAHSACRTVIGRSFEEQLRFGGLNERFQDVCDQIDSLEGRETVLWERIQMNERLFLLAHDFERIVTTYGKIIAQEHYLPEAEKTIQPRNLGGVAGGKKFICRGVLFKFAIDEYGLYGSDVGAAKVASHELRALSVVHNHCRATGIRVPMAAVFDYCGVRLLAVALLPIDQETLRYGSCDGAKTVHTDPDFVEIADDLGRSLRLAPHMAGRKDRQHKEVSLCVDAEGHRGHDGRPYLIDCARLFPPQTPDPSVRACFLVRLFRPEFVRKYERATLCSDAYSKFLQGPEGPTFLEQVDEATALLRCSTVPAVSERLLNLLSCWLRGGTSLFDFSPIMISTLHAAGVNLRLLGLVSEHMVAASSNGDVRHRQCASLLQYLVCAEVVSRAMKRMLRERLRLAAQELHLSVESTFVVVSVDFLNEFLGKEVRLTGDELKDPHLVGELGLRTHRRRTAADRTQVVDQIMSICVREFELSEERRGIVERLLGNAPVVHPTQLRGMARSRWSHGFGCALILRRLEDLMGLQVAGAASGKQQFQVEDVMSAGQRLKHMGIVHHALG
jgi:Clustered mitochondria/Translation initiation factor eIF3 subunit 135